MFDGLRWVVGTALIYAEWQVYTTPVLRRSTALAVLWYLLCAALASPFLLVWLPLEAATLGWLCCRGAPAAGAPIDTAGTKRVAKPDRSPSRSRSRSPARRGGGLIAGRGVGGAELRVASYNIQSGVGSDMELNIARIARALVRMGPLDLVALQEIDVTSAEDQVAEIARLAGFAHHAFVGTRPSKLGAGQYGDAVLSRLPIEATHVHNFKRWWLRAERACLFVQVRLPSATKASRSRQQPTTSGHDGCIWFGSAHLQHDITALENGAQLRELRQAIATSLPGGDGRTVVGLDANMLGWPRLVHAAEAAGLVEHCGVRHPSTFPAVSPLYRLDGLLSAKRGGSGAGTVGDVTVRVTDGDMALSAVGSWDPETGEHSSDHMPVVGTLMEIATV
jgi:hypothetical protein